jgi:CheY-like chemotaxis protein
VARKIVREHRGEIVAESDGLGRGSRFIVRLPGAVAPPARTPAAQRATSSVRHRIVVADDNVDFVDMFRAALESWGHETRPAYDGPQALRVCEEFEPEVVFLDIGLPGMDGYEVAGRLRATAGESGTRIIAVSGYVGEADRARAASSGFSDHLAKPLDLLDIARLLDDAPA